MTDNGAPTDPGGTFAAVPTPAPPISHDAQTQAAKLLIGVYLRGQSDALARIGVPVVVVLDPEKVRAMLEQATGLVYPTAFVRRVIDETQTTVATIRRQGRRS